MAIKKKVAAKPAAKKAISSKKPATGSKSKPAARPAAKKPVAKANPAHAKKAASSIAKSASKKTSKPTAKPVAKKPAAPAKAVKQPAKPMKPVAKTVAPKKVPAKPVVKVVAKAASKVVPPAKPAQPKVGKKGVAKVIAPKKSPIGLKPLPKKEIPKPAFVPPKQIIAPPPFKKKPPKEVPPVRTGKLVIPEIKTKTVRKYEPDFTKSVLDTPMQDPSAPSQRYSDADLAEFRDLINKKLEAARTELTYLQGLITRKDEMGGDETDNRYMTMEDGSMSMEREQLSQMASRQITYIDHLEKALMRIENKTYGVCRVTGRLIDKARLRAVPHATLSIEAKQMQK
jgi:RNA polymerase-binding transcription factor DksA